MLHETNITFDGCRIWLDGNTKRDLKRAIARLEHWIKEFIENPPHFSTVGKQKQKYVTNPSINANDPKDRATTRAIHSPL